MYISKNTHILSDALMKTAVINIAGSAVSAVIRKILENKYLIFFPSMSVDGIWYSQVIVSVLQIAATAVVFYLEYTKLSKKKSVVELDDLVEMAKLQEEVNPGGVSTLSAYSISQLLQIWAVILVGVRCLYEMSSIVYRRFIMQISQIAITASLFGGVELAEVYNNTHGFKYIGMFTAFVLGIVMTAIFLRDRMLKLVCLGITLFFMLAFVVINMGNINILGNSIGIVWTSIIFHVCETGGLMGLAVYLEKKYRGL